MPIQDKKVILLRHFRHETREWFWEFPRGFGEPGLSGEKNAEKELMEEIGLSPRKMVEIWRDPETAFFYAEMQDGEPHIREDEAIQRIELVDINELEDWILTGKITDWFTLLAFLMAQKRGCFSI
jgi:ADP-ribose pyrophosphatase